MSLIGAVAQAVADLGGASVDDLVPLFPGYSRERLKKALVNCLTAGYLEREPEPKRAQRAPARYRAATRPRDVRPYTRRTRVSAMPRVASVFDLASGVSVSLPAGHGRRYSKLGGWND